MSGKLSEDFDRFWENLYSDDKSRIIYLIKEDWIEGELAQEPTIDETESPHISTG